MFTVQRGVSFDGLIIDSGRWIEVVVVNFLSRGSSYFCVRLCVYSAGATANSRQVFYLFFCDITIQRVDQTTTRAAAESEYSVEEFV